MNNYYRHLTPGDPLCEAARDLRRDEYWLWQKYRPPLDADIELAAHDLASRTGESPRRIINITCALHRLDELPRLKASQEEYFHLNFPRLIAIDDVLSKLGHPEDDVLERLDAAITAYLTPKSPGAALPSQANLRRKLHTLIMTEDDTILRKPRKTEDDPDTPAEPAGESAYSVSRSSGASTALIAEFPDEIAASLDAVITQTARERNISAAAALAGLITRKFDPSPDVTLHVYRACDVDSAPVYVRGFGWIDPLIGDVLTASPSRVVDHTSGAKAKTTNYVTPNRMRAYTEGRDGTCRFPQCTVPAMRCQKDHAVDHHSGGPTAPYNLVNLCQHHHNIKTDGRATYVIDPATDDLIWLFDNGTWHRTHATGPMSQRSKRWLQTTAQRIHARRTRAHEGATT